MYKFIFVITLLLNGCFGYAQPVKPELTEGIQVNVSIANALSDNGQILLALYTKEGFNEKKPFQTLALEIKDKKSAGTFKNIPPGTYAIIALHDENLNQRMDFQPNGIPKEAWATTGNDFSMGPPDFETSKFKVAGKNLDLHLRF